MKTELEELQQSWKQPWPREELLQQDRYQVMVPDSNPAENDSVGEKEPELKTFQKRGRGGRPGPRRRGIDKISRRREVIKLMKKTPELTSHQIAKMLNESRGTVWHDILYIRKVVPELANWGIKGKGRWVNQYGSAAEAETTEAS